ncbi:hypothetical protein GCM10011391_12390 [Pullulanibacillus camelliae]|uniref:DUF4352 domain-containing protein n=1 Tax=Pullulanibacillus camelliae TaxID=1707096 RepID=A0A8J2YGH4_9BACL|nr:hypothetical protein [Pullulanibacillus camelliae]GGE35195.1 hypothetical protein GCM10011391_12390 [Pullulanibacillus camelliae]
MKKYIAIILSILLLVVLAACANNSDQGTKEQSDAKKAHVVKKKKVSNDPDGNDPTLTRVGETYKTNDSTTTLKRIYDVKQSVDVKPIKLTIGSIKFLAFTHLDTDMQESYGLHSDHFNGLQLSYEVQNTSKDTVNMYPPIDKVILSTGQQISMENNDYLDASTDDTFYGQAKQKGYCGFILPDDVNINEVKWIKIVTSDTWSNDEDGTELSEPQVTKVQF